MWSETGTDQYATNPASIQRLRSAYRLARLAAAHIRAATGDVRRPFNRSIHLWLLAFAVGGFTYFGVHAVLFNLYLLRLGFQPAFIGLLIGSGQIIWAVVALPAGELGRRVGVRGAFTFGLVLLGAAYAFLLCVEALPRSVWVVWLLWWWALVWVGAALATVNSIPYAMSLAGDSAPRAFAVQAAVIGTTSFVGSLAGAALLGVVADWTGSSILEPGPYRIVLWLTPLAFLASGAAMLAAEPSTEVAPSQTSVAGQRSPFGLFVFLALTVFLFAAGEGTLRTFFNVYLDTSLLSTPVQIGVTMGLAQILPAVAALAVPALVARFGSAGTLSLASVVSAGGLVVVGTIPLLPVAGILIWWRCRCPRYTTQPAVFSVSNWLTCHGVRQWRPS